MDAPKMNVKGMVFAIIACVLVVIALQGEKWYWTYVPDKWITPLIIYGEKDKEISILGVYDDATDTYRKEIYPGDEVVYALDCDKVKPQYLPTVRRQIENTIILTYVPSYPTKHEAGRKIRKASLLLPKSTDAGKHRLLWSVTYEVGPYKRPVTLSAGSDVFYVKEDHSEANEIGLIKKMIRENNSQIRENKAAAAKMKRWQDVPESREAK